MKSLKKLTLTLVLGAFLAPLAQAAEKPVFIQFARPLGMGGAFTAVADDHNIFAYNPAGMVQRTGGQFTLLHIAGGISEDAKDALEFLSDNEDQLTDFDRLTLQQQVALTNEIINNISKLDPRVYLAADIASYVSGPSFWGTGLHAGFGAFGSVDTTFALNAALTVPNITFDINNDILIPLSIAKRFDPSWIPGQIGFGATGKLIKRNQVRRERLSVLALEDFDPEIAEGTGFGGDFGILWQPSNRTNVGLMVQDIFGTNISFDSVAATKGYPAIPDRDTVIRPRTNIGIARIPEKLLWFIPTGDRWTLAADVRDIFERDQHVFFQSGLRKPFGDDLYEKLFLGAEFRYWFLRFRGGAHQGYPSFGLGMDIPFLKLDYAYYSRELGARAGDRREENHIASLAFRFGSGGTESRERIGKSKKGGNLNDVP